jgi:hypothetical protein
MAPKSKKHSVGGASVRQKQLRTVHAIIEQRRLKKEAAEAKLAGPSEAARSADSASTASRDLGAPAPKKAKTEGSEDRSAI